MGNLYQLGEHMLSRLLELCFPPTTAPLCQGEFDFSLLNCVNKHHSSDCFQVTPEKSRMSFAQSKVISLYLQYGKILFLNRRYGAPELRVGDTTLRGQRSSKWLQLPAIALNHPSINHF